MSFDDISFFLPPIEEVHSLLKALVLFQFDGQAEKLQLAYEEALQMMAAALPEVWQEGLQRNQIPVTATFYHYIHNNSVKVIPFEP